MLRLHFRRAISFTITALLSSTFFAPIMAASIGSVTGFESTAYWSASTGGVSLSTTASQGSYSLAVHPNDYTVYTSSPISSTGPIEHVSFDIRLPAYGIFFFWKGDAQMFIECPSQGVYNQYMGYVNLNPLSSEVWHTIQFSSSEEVNNLLRGKTYHDLTLKIVLNVPFNIGGQYYLDNMKIEGNTLNVRVMAVVLGSDGSSGHTTDLYKTGFTRDSVINAMQFLTDSWAKTGINFQFNPKSDILEAKSSLLNEEFPIASGNIILPLPPKGVDDFVDNTNVVAQRKFADELGDVVVVYFRDAEYSWYSYTDPVTGKNMNALPAGAWSGLDHKYVRFPKALTLVGRYATWPQLLSHETGHYFSLAHTHAAMYNSATETADTIKSKVDRKEYTKTTIWDHFDGDKGTGVEDTPADVGEFVIAEANGGTKCGSVGAVNIPVNFADGTSQTYSFTPLRDNIISYYVECNDATSLNFTPNQKEKVRSTANWDSRRAALTAPSGVRVTAVFAPFSGEEHQSFLWEYDPHRKNYDYIWTDGWRLSQLRTYNRHGTLHYSATWQQSTSSEFQIYNATYEEYRAYYDTKWNEGFRLQNLSISVISGIPRYTAVFRPSTSSEFQIYNATYNEYRSWYDQKWNEGYRLFLLEPYVIDDQIRYTAVVRPSTSGEFQVYNYRYVDYRSWYDQKWNEGYRLNNLKVLKVPGQEPAYFAVVKPDVSAEYQVYNWTYEDFRVKYDELSKQGWTLKSLNFYE